MATSAYFNNFRSPSEQGLIEDLVIESIKIYGIDVNYIPRISVQSDDLYNEDSVRRYANNYSVEMYIKNIDGFGGDGDFLSKFNITINDTVTVTVAIKQFNQYIGIPHNLVRPREGDLVFFPLNNKLFEIKFVEHEPVFYQLGALQMYDLKLELFEYSNEIFNTGITYVDRLGDDRNLDNVYRESSLDTTFNANAAISIINADPTADNVTIQAIANTFISFDENDPFAEGNY